MELPIKILLVIIGIFGVTAAVCSDIFLISKVAEHAYTLLIAPNVVGAPALSWKVFGGVVTILSVLTINSRINNRVEHDNAAESIGYDIGIFAVKCVALGIVYIAIGWLA